MGSRALPAAKAARAAPRIYYVHPLVLGRLEAWDDVFEHASDLGFDAILSAPPFAVAPGNSLLLPEDMARLHPALGDGAAADGIARLVDRAKRYRLDLLLDVVVDRVAAHGSFAKELGLKAPTLEIFDPRRDPADQGAVIVPFDGSDPAEHPYIHALSGQLGKLAAAGVLGFRCLHWDRLPAAALKRLAASVRGDAPGVQFLAWTPGTAFDARWPLEAAGFDGAFASSCWWNLKDRWIADEHELQRRFGYTIGFPEAPFDKRLTHELETDEILQRRAERALWIAASTADGIMMPMGFEYGSRERLDATRGDQAGLAGLKASGSLDLCDKVKSANKLLASEPIGFQRSPLRLKIDDAASVTAIMRVDAPDLRQASAARLTVANTDLRKTAATSLSFLISEVGSRFLPFCERGEPNKPLSLADKVTLGPGEVRILTGHAPEPIAGATTVSTVEEAVSAPRLVIEAITPAVDDGEFPVKRTIGQLVHVEADIFGDGHDPLAAALRWRPIDVEEWQETRMALVGNDRWVGQFALERIGRYEFTVEAWRDPFAIYRDELGKKYAAGLDLTLELEEGRRLVQAAFDENEGSVAKEVEPLARRLADANYASRVEVLMAAETAAVMTRADRRAFKLRSKPMPIDSERSGAEFASWYELFPRSMSGDPTRHGTFDDVVKRLPAIREMGFDVLYFPPIHPIGKTNRKGRNNTLTAGPDDPGSPYAIGSEAGGYDSIHPELGSFDDFERLRLAAADHGLELAMDIAINVSPDHPWLKEHPDWFEWRPDGTLKFAENPPKKYEDIANVSFYAKGAMPSLWVALRDVILFWVGKGVKLYRIDNPHTKPFPFWEWLIGDVRRDHPDVVFLAEAFTHPKVMYRLGKVGFSQSYTYFTWRDAKWELTEYLTELTQTAPKDFFRPHFFVNTPDINPDFLQDAPRSAFLIRAALAATLSGLWGMYNGFELCEGRPDVKRKEYADSEKYEIRAWDWDRPGNIIAEISALNRLRRDNPALHTHHGITFLPAYNDNVLFYEKATPERENVVMVAVSLDPHNVQEADLEIPLWKFGLPDSGSLMVEDLVRGEHFTWTGKYQHVRCDPGEMPFSIWRVASKG